MVANETLYIILLVACVILTAFFNSSEMAFFSLQRVRVEQMVSLEVKGAARIARLIQRPDRLLSVILLGTNLVMTAASALATALVVSVWEQNIWIAVVGMTAILLVFAETTPKTIANRHAERVSSSFARPIEILYWVFFPFVYLLSWMASGITRLVGGTPVPRSLVSEEEIRTMITVGHKEGTMEENEVKMLHKVFDFGDRPVHEVMVPRTEVIWVEKGTSLADFFKIYAETPMSRFPVFEENRDNVTGVLSVKDVLMTWAKNGISQEDTVDDLIRPAYFTPESKCIGELFSEMRDKNYRVAVVVDEYGGTAGIVSLSGLLEEIVGAVGDELADIDKEFEAIDEHTFQVDGGMRIEEANEEMDLDLPESEDYETVAGFILSLLGRIPESGEIIRYKTMNLRITEMRGLKIEKILLAKGLAKREDAPPAD